jgi:YARHG domain
MRLKNITLSLLMTTAFLSSTMVVSAQEYQNYSCSDLWKERNSIFKEAGYCFKTSRAQRYFGNAGCQYDRDIDCLYRKEIGLLLLKLNE